MGHCRCRRVWLVGIRFSCHKDLTTCSMLTGSLSARTACCTQMPTLKTYQDVWALGVGLGVHALVTILVSGWGNHQQRPGTACSRFQDKVRNPGTGHNGSAGGKLRRTQRYLLRVPLNVPASRLNSHHPNTKTMHTVQGWRIPPAATHLPNFGRSACLAVMCIGGLWWLGVLRHY